MDTPLPPAQPEPPPEPIVAVYTGKKSGRYLANVEAADLTEAQRVASGYTLADLFASGLYAPPAPPAPPKEDKKPSGVKAADPPPSEVR